MATLTIDLRDAKRAQEIIRNENLPLPLSWLASDTYFCNRPDRDDMEDISEILHMHGIQHHWTAQDTPEPEPEPKTETRAVHSLAYHPTKIWDFICKMYGGDTLRHYITRHDYEGFADTISQEFHLNPEQWEAVLENFELITSTLMDI